MSFLSKFIRRNIRIITVFCIENWDIFRKIAWNIRHGSKKFKHGVFICLESNLVKVSYNT
jgi:hypothetical protein